MPRFSARQAAPTRSRPDSAEVTEPGARYVDFLVPGLLGMNLMGTGMWGIGFSLVVARNGNLLKRLVAAPVRKSHLLGAQLMSRLIFLIPEAGALLLFAYFALGVPFRGSLFLLDRRLAAWRARVQRPGAACRRAPAHHRRRVRHHESGHGADVDLLRHLLLDRAFPGHDAAVRAGAAADCLNDALRGVMLEGTGLVPLLPAVALLAAWGAASFIVALRIFRWQ